MIFLNRRGIPDNIVNSNNKNNNNNNNNDKDENKNKNKSSNNNNKKNNNHENENENENDNDSSSNDINGNLDGGDGTQKKNKKRLPRERPDEQRLEIPDSGAIFLSKKVEFEPSSFCDE